MIITNNTIIIMCNNEKELIHRISWLDPFQANNWKDGMVNQRTFIWLAQYE